MPFIMDGIWSAPPRRARHAQLDVQSHGRYFLLFYALRPWIGNNALWLAFTLYMFLRGVLQYLHDPRPADHPRKA